MPADGEMTADDWAAARKIIEAGNESYIADEIVRRLAQRGFKLVKLRDDDHAYVAGLLKTGETFG